MATNLDTPKKKRIVRSGWHKVSPSEYTEVKQLLGVGLTVRQVAELKNRSYNTILWMKRTESMDEYLKEVNDKAARLHELRKAKKAAAEAAKAAKAAKAASKAQEPGLPVEQLEKTPERTDAPERPELDTYTYEYTSRDAQLERIATTSERIATALERLAEAWERQPEPKKTSIFGR